MMNKRNRHLKRLIAALLAAFLIGQMTPAFALEPDGNPESPPQATTAPLYDVEGTGGGEDTPEPETPVEGPTEGQETAPEPEPEEEPEPITTEEDLIQAIQDAAEGAVIPFSGYITLWEGIGDPEKRVTIQRANGDSQLIFTSSHVVGGTVQNITFDGNSLGAFNPMVKLTDGYIAENCVFQNCGDPDVDMGTLGGALETGGSSTVVLTNCTFRNNTAATGGHLYVGGYGTTRLQNCTFTGGHAFNQGGAIQIYDQTACIVDSCTITGNSAGMLGGGISNGGTLTVSNSKIYGNTAALVGADLATTKSATTDLQDSAEELVALFAPDQLLPTGWVSDYDEENPIPAYLLESYSPEESFLKLAYEVVEPEPEPEEPDPEPEPTPDPEPDPEPEPEEPAPEPDPEPDDPTPEPSPEPDPIPDPEPAPEEPEPAEPDPTPDPEPQPEPSPDPVPDPEPAPDPEPDPEPAPEPDPLPLPEPSPEPSPDPEPAPAPSPAPVYIVEPDTSDDWPSTPPSAPVVTAKEEPHEITLTNGRAAITPPDAAYWAGYISAHAGGAGSVRREELAFLIVSMMVQEIPEGYSAPFVDVDGSSPYAAAIATVYNTGIMVGMGNGCFGPDRAITWAELITVFSRFAGNVEAPEVFTGQHWAKDAINTAIALGWMDYSESFDPGGGVSCAEAVQFIQTVFQWASD